MPSTPGANSARNAIAHATKLPVKPVENLKSGSVKTPVLKSSERAIDPALENQVDQLDAFIDANDSFNLAIVARLKTAAKGETSEQLMDATRAMRVFAVRRMWQPGVAPAMSDNLKTFARLWAAANEAERSGKALRGTAALNLEFGPVFSGMINEINGAEVSLAPRK